MISFSQEFIVLEPVCNLRCTFCELWKTEADSYSDHMKTLIQKKLLFKFFNKKQLIHIVGGDPFLSPQLGPLLDLIRSNRKRSAVWTNGLAVKPEHIALISKIDFVHIYFPSPDKDLFKSITGENGFEDWKAMVYTLLRQNKQVSLHYQIREGELEFLPDVHEFAKQFNLMLILHYPKNHTFDTNRLAYINRFRWLKKVMIFKTDAPPATMCQALPFDGIRDPYQVFFNMVTMNLSSLKHKLGL